MDVFEKNFTKEKSQEVANKLTPFIQLIDVLLDDFDIEYAKAAVKRISADASTAMSASILFGTDGVGMADDARERADFFESLIKVFEVRKRQREGGLKRLQDKGARQKLAQQLGLI